MVQHKYGLQNNWCIIPKLIVPNRKLTQLEIGKRQNLKGSWAIKNVLNLTVFVEKKISLVTQSVARKPLIKIKEIVF